MSPGAVLQQPEHHQQHHAAGLSWEKRGILANSTSIEFAHPSRSDSSDRGGSFFIQNSVSPLEAGQPQIALIETLESILGE